MKPSPSALKSTAADFIRSETTGGIALLVAVFIALAWANLISGEGYLDFWHTGLSVNLGLITIGQDLQHWVNDGLMAIFFFVVGLEIKRELAVGELTEKRKAALPVIAACGGALVPALIFIGFNFGGLYSGGWAIPMATDIAFAVAVIALLGSRIPSGVRLLLLTIAIVDDVLAIAVIALVYTESIQIAWLAFGVGGLVLVVLLRRFGLSRPIWYLPIGILIWIGFFQSGVHATIAGVALGLLTPAGMFNGRDVLRSLERALHPWSSLVIVPIFALANAGIVVTREVLGDAIVSPVFQGIIAGLVLGKIFGITGATFLARKLGIVDLPSGATTRHVWGVAALGGIGFTVSIFITGLSFTDPEAIEIAKIGIFTGSIISAAVGVMLLMRRSTKPSADK